MRELDRTYSVVKISESCWFSSISNNDRVNKGCDQQSLDLGRASGKKNNEN